MRTTILAAAGLLCASAAIAQAPPIGIDPPPLSYEPYVFDTAEQHGIEVTLLAKGFPRPFALEFLPDGDLLIAERGGNLRILRRPGTPAHALDAAPISGMPVPGVKGNQGLHDIALHPEFARNGWLYFTYNDPVPNAEGENGPPRNAHLQLMRGKLAKGHLTDVETLFTTEPGFAGGSRIAFAPDGALFLATGAPFGEGAQDMAGTHGKILRLKDDGSIPEDNPYVGQEGVHPAVFSHGHRDQHGLAIHQASGTVLAAEHGPNGGDELNRIVARGNYGWPDYTFGRNYDGTEIPGMPLAEGIEKPLAVWLPSIGISGLMVYEADAFPAWTGNVFVASARRGEIDHTGGLERVVFNADFGELRRETLLTQLHIRVRDMATGPEGNIYVLSDGPENAVLRVEPAPLD